MTATNPDPVTTAEVYAWHLDRFGVPDVALVMGKLAEETGEVCGAIVKRAEGAVRPAKGLVTREDWSAHLLDEIGDVGIVLHTLCAREGHTLDEVVTARFREDVALRVGQERSTAGPLPLLPVDSDDGRYLALVAELGPCWCDTGGVCSENVDDATPPDKVCRVCRALDPENPCPTVDEDAGYPPIPGPDVLLAYLRRVVARHLPPVNDDEPKHAARHRALVERLQHDHPETP